MSNVDLVKYDAACRAVAEARSIDEVKDIYDKSIAIMAYARQAENKELEADAFEIRQRAKRKLGELLIERKETEGFNPGTRTVGGGGFSGGYIKEPPEDKPTLEEQLGRKKSAAKKLSSQAQKLASISEEEFEKDLAEQRQEFIDKDQEHIKGTFGSGDNEWYTPKEYIDRAKEVLGEIDLDPASSRSAQTVVQAKDYFDEETDGLEQEWFGRVWLNPPYTQPNISNFVHKLCEEYESGRIKEAILLTHNYSDTSWYQEAGLHAVGICEVAGRIKFYNQKGDIAAPTQGQHFFYFGKNWDKFKDVFNETGLLAKFEKD